MSSPTNSPTPEARWQELSAKYPDLVDEIETFCDALRKGKNDGDLDALQRRLNKVKLDLDDIVISSVNVRDQHARRLAQAQEEVARLSNESALVKENTELRAENESLRVEIRGLRSVLARSVIK